ncbi:hypothetical protein L3Q67_38635 [Saccharothrix sp. AJ9571]|nr:hypothetical protein L3Q67_38635 [Saccharothrix sp. AJ9571]
MSTDHLDAITTVIRDQLRGEELVRLPGAVCLPPGSVIDLPDGVIARVTTMRLVVQDAASAELVIQAVPYGDTLSGRT